MRKRTLRHIVGILARYRRHGVWRKIVSVMCCIVVFCTTYAMILPAITLERAPTCGKEEHTHTQECYTKVTEEAKRIPVCSLERLGVHTHTEACKDETGAICCYDATFVVHEHDGSCYENGNLICPLPEIKAHTHDDSCYEAVQTETHTEKERGDLICTLPTDTAHTHTEECYTGEPVLTCQLPEEEGHRHSDACYHENGELICGQEEREGHTHNENCYQTTPVLTCTLSEEPHRHTDECYDWIEVEVKDPPVEPVLICDKKEIILHTHTMADCYRSDEYKHNYLVCTTLQIKEHVHTPDCFRTVEADPDVLTCGREEGPDHTHTDLCYGQWTLTCGKEEHTHTDECRQAPPAEFRWSRDGLEITAAFDPEVELPEGAALTVERWTPETPVPLPQLLASFAAQPIADTPDGTETETAPDGNGTETETAPDGNGTETDTPVGNGLAHSSQEAETETPDGNASETEPAAAQQASLLAAEEVPPQQIMSNCMDYFRVYLSVDGVEVDTQAPAEVSIRLQSDKYLDASHVELVQVTDNSVLAQADQTGSLTASFTGAVAGDYAVLAEAPRAAGTKPAASITPSKTIEALTEANTYRLHLDAVVGGSMANQPMNMLLVLDQSGSMRNTMGEKDGTIRQKVVRSVVNGGSGADYDEDAHADGLIATFLAMNDSNQIAVVTFQGSENNPGSDAGVVLGWTKKTARTPYVDLSDSLSLMGATNYCAALKKAGAELDKINNSNPTIVVFLSDGQPTYYETESGSRGGDGSDSDSNVSVSTEWSKKYYTNHFLKNHPDVKVYTVGISDEIVGGDKDEILQMMAADGGGQYFPATTADELRAAITSISSGETYTALKIEDKLSTYVDLADDPQYRVTKKSADGTEVTLWEGTSATADGTGIINSVVCDTGTKTITATFDPNYELDPGATYSLSYNVKVSDQAHQEYTDSGNQYPVDTGGNPIVGDPNTDYDPTKVTSSGQPGFRSNEVATMFYKADGKDGSKTYPHPVVQVSEEAGGSELKLTTHKTIDYLGDEGTNGDTTLTGADMYRLYLDAEVGPPVGMPMDLLLVVDQSLSMRNNEMGNGKSREQTLLDVLNGDDGLIRSFVGMHEENRIAVIGFDGKIYSDNDVDELRGWGRNNNDIQLGSETYTNYMRALEKASDFLAQARPDGTSPSSNPKVMVFLSDGDPTVYYERYNADGMSGKVLDYYSGGKTAIPKTQDYFDNYFKPNNTDVTIYTVSISNDAQSGLLSHMATDEQHYFTATKADDLEKALEAIRRGNAYTNVKIQDELSAYVDIHAKPDYKVTMKNAAGVETVLWQGDAPTDAGKGIIQSVGTEGKIVTATFVSSYILEPDCTYTLSYNVQVTNQAYEEYKNNGNQYPTGVTGNGNTDYGSNATSSGKPGFYSNKEAKLIYTKDSETTPSEKPYKHPVVQVNPSSYTVKKQWLSYGGVKDITDSQTDVLSIQFQLIKIATPQAVPTQETRTVHVTSRYGDGGWYMYDGPSRTWDNAPLGSTATLKFQVSNPGNKVVTVNGSGISGNNGVYTYEFTVNENKDINIKCTNSNGIWNNPITILSCEFTNVPQISLDPVRLPYGDPKTLSKDNNWQMSFSDLPKTGQETIGGKVVDVTYTYDVEELPFDGSDGYGTSYDTVPGDGSRGTVVTIKNQSKTQTYKIIVQKVSSEDNTQMLSGAKFDIYRKTQGGEKLGDLEGTYIKLDLGNDLIATGDNGQMEFDGLAPGDYCLVETKAPSGYHKYTAPIPFTLGTGGKVTCSATGISVTQDGTVSTITVPNKPWGHRLPSTGGTGREPYTIGGLLIIGFAVLLLYNKKRGKEDAISS